MGPKKGVDVGPPRDRPEDREKIIAEALIDVASELRLTDVAELIHLIRNEEDANLADLVSSSTELFYRNGALRYALSASFNAPWNATPEVALDMEFRYECVTAFFRLTIGEKRARVEILDVLFDEDGLDEGAQVERLAAALAGARTSAASPRPGCAVDS
jgi:hypothetical protein